MALSRAHVSILGVSILGLGAAVLLATQSVDTRAQAQTAAEMRMPKMTTVTMTSTKVKPWSAEALGRRIEYPQLER